MTTENVAVMTGIHFKIYQKIYIFYEIIYL